MSWIISVERVSRAVREDGEILGNMVTGGGASGDETIWTGDNLLSI